MKNKLNPRLMILLGVVAVIIVLAISVFASMELQMVLKGDAEITLEYGEAVPEDIGAKTVLKSWLLGTMEVDAQVTGDVQISPDKLGSHTVTYSANYLWFTASAQRTVRVVDTQAPVIVLIYDADSYTLPGHEYVEEGFSAEDNHDGDLTAQVQRVVVNNCVYYTVTDSSGNKATVERPIKYNDFEAPVLTLLGQQTVTIRAGQKFNEPGFTAVDNAEGDVSSKVVISNDHDTNKAGTYTITYTVTDNFGNTATATRTLVVKAADQPTVVVPEGAVIYLTFDDGPGPYTRQLLDVLKKYDVKATFFVCDKGDKYNKIMADIVNEGHAIAIHSASHDYNKIYASEEAFFNDLNTMSDVIYKYSGVRTTLMRFPGGSSNMVSKFNPGIMTRLTKMVEEQGYQYFDWNVDSDDAGSTRNSDGVFYNVVHGKNNTWRGCEDGKVSVVLQHDIHKYSVEAVERIIQWGLANGYTFLPLDATSPTAHHRVNN